MKPGVPEPRSCSAASGAGSRSGWRGDDARTAPRAQPRAARDERPTGAPSSPPYIVTTPLDARAAPRAGARRACPRCRSPRRRRAPAAPRAAGSAIASSAAMKPPIELPTTHGRVDARARRSSASSDPRVARDRDRARRASARRRSPAGRARRPVVAREVRGCSQPVLPRAREAVDEARSASARRPMLDDVDRRARRPRPSAGARASRRRARRERPDGP